MDGANTSETTPDPALVAAVATKIEKDKGLVIPPKPPSSKNNSWSAIISILIILAMVIIGAFYAWGQRISEERAAKLQMQEETQNSAQTY